MHPGESSASDSAPTDSDTGGKTKPPASGESSHAAHRPEFPSGREVACGRGLAPDALVPDIVFRVGFEDQRIKRQGFDLAGLYFFAVLVELIAQALEVPRRPS